MSVLLKIPLFSMVFQTVLHCFQSCIYHFQRLQTRISHDFWRFTSFFPGLTGLGLLPLSLLTHVVIFSSLSARPSLVLDPSDQIFTNLSCWWWVSFMKGSALVPLGSILLHVHRAETNSQPCPSVYSCSQLSIASYSLARAYCWAMMDSNIHTSACKMLIYLSEDFSCSAVDLDWTQCGVVMGSMDISMVYLFVLGPPYNVGQC